LLSLGTSATRTCELSIEGSPSCAPSPWHIRPGGRSGTSRWRSLSCPSREEHQIRLHCRLVKGRLCWQTRAPGLGVEPSSPAFAWRRGASKADACNLHDPRARPGSPEPRSAASRLPSRTAFRVACLLREITLARCLLRGLASRASLIRGPRRLSPFRALPGAIARTEVGYPDPGDPDTFCRRRVARKAGVANLAGGLRLLLRAHRASSLTRNPPPGASLSQDLPAGPLPVSPREGSHVPRSPRCLPSRAALLRGW
jgi:hypothetical protein